MACKGTCQSARAARGDKRTARIVQQGLPDGYGHGDFAAMMQTWAMVEDLPEVVNAGIGDAIEELTQLALIPHVVAVQTDEVLEEVEPPKEPPEMGVVEQALITPMDYTKGTAGISKQHELLLSLQNSEWKSTEF
jgi:hypothetical protein